MGKRACGGTGERLRMVGFGGIAVMDEEPSSGGPQRGRGRVGCPGAALGCGNRVSR